MNKLRSCIFFVFFVLLLTIFYPTPVYGASCSNTTDGYFNVCVTAPDPSTSCLPSPGDSITVTVTITSRIRNPFPVVIVVDYGVDITNGTDYVEDPNYRSKQVRVPAYQAAGWSDSSDFSFRILANSCERGFCSNVNFSVAPFITYFNTKKVTTGTGFNFDSGIGGVLYGKIYQPDGVTPAGSATVTLSSTQSECGRTSRSVTTGDGGSYFFDATNCCFGHTLTASKVINSRTCTASSNPSICNASMTERNLTLSCASPSPSSSPNPSSSPSPSPSSSASPSPSPTPGPKTASLTAGCPGGTATLYASWDVGEGSNCNAYIQAGGNPHVISTDCSSGGQRTIQDNTYIWDGGTYQLHVGDPDGGTTSSSSVTVDCDNPPPSPPPPEQEKPPPYFQTILEVANLTKGQTLPDDCGPNECRNQPSWPPACGRALRTTTQASPGDQIQVRICMRRMGGDSPINRDTTNAVWLDQAFPGTINLAQGGRDFFSPDFMESGRRSGTYTYHSFHRAASLRVPYNWYKWAGPTSCGDRNGNEWYYACVKALNMTFFIKDDLNLLEKTLSTKSSLFISPYVKPYSDFHPYLTSCLNAAQTGFWERTPECCWGQPFYRNDVGGYPGCPIPQGDPRYNQCGYGSCDTGEKEEDFMFWSNWIRINVKTTAPWIQVTGDVHSNGRINVPGGP